MAISAFGFGSHSSCPVSTQVEAFRILLLSRNMHEMYIESLDRYGAASSGSFLFFHSITNGNQHKPHRLIGSGFVGNNAVVKEVPNDGKVSEALRCVNECRICRLPTSDLTAELNNKVTAQRIFIRGLCANARFLDPVHLARIFLDKL